MNFSGIWFFGLSGVGKTYASKYLLNKISPSILIDGDIVRKKISNDLGYSIKDRKIQIRRLLNIGIIAINSNIVPIISSVYMDNEVLRKAKKNKIKVIKISKNMKEIFKNHKTYKNKKNVIGIDLKYEKINIKEIFNSGDKKFWIQLNLLIK